jgi:hypothetical protein
MNDIKRGDVVRFKKVMKWVDGKTYADEYTVDGLVPDAFGKLSVCLVDVPGCWPVKNVVLVEAA